MHYVKPYYRSFISIFRSAGGVRNELVTLHLVSANLTLLQLLSAVVAVSGCCSAAVADANRICYESLNLTVTEIRSLQHTWQCAVSHIFNISGQKLC